MSASQPNTTNAMDAVNSIHIDTVREIDEVWHDNFADVPDIHLGAKNELNRRLALLADPNAEPINSILPIIGNAGSGKTHILTDLFLNTARYNGIFVPVDISMLNDFYDLVNTRIIYSLTVEIPGRTPQLSRLIANIIKYTVLSNKTLEPEAVTDAFRDFSEGDIATAAAKVRRELMNKDSHNARIYGDIITAVFLLASNSRKSSSIGRNILESMEISEEDKAKYNIAESLSPPRLVFDGLTWLISLNNSFSVFAFDQFDALIKEPAGGALGGAGSPNSDNAGALHSIASDFFSQLARVKSLSPKTFVVLTMFADTWGKINNFPYYKSQIQNTFDRLLALDPMTDSRQAEKMVLKILNRAWREYNVTPQYPTWPFPEAFFKKVEGLLPRGVLKEAEKHIDKCKRLKSVIEWDPDNPDYSPSADDALIKEIQAAFNEGLQRANTAELSGKDSEMPFWREAIISFAKCFSAEHEESINGFTVQAAFQQDNPKKMLASANITLTDKRGIAAKNLHIAANLQDNANAFQSRLKSALVESGIKKTIQNRKLALIRFSPPPGGPKTAKMWEDFLSAGGISLVPDDRAVAYFCAVKSVLEKYGEHEWKIWAKAEKPVRASRILEKHLLSLTGA